MITWSWQRQIERTLAALLAVFALAAESQSAPVQTSAESAPPATTGSVADPLELLVGSTYAARSQAYRGTIVLIQGGAPTSIAVEHRLVGEGSELRYVALDGAPYGMQLNYADRDCQLFGDPVASLTQLPQQSSGVGQVPLVDYYQLQFLGVQRVADRFSYALIALPKDDLRYARRLFIDANSGILLRSEYLSAVGQLLASSQFIAFHETPSEDAEVAPPELLEPTAAVVPCQSSAEQERRITAAEQSSWRLDWWPIGFVLTDYRRDATGLESFLFSDGLAQFSLFVDPANRLAVESIGGSRGATSAVIRQLQNDQLQLAVTVSVVGELPRAAAEQILSAVRLAPSQAAGQR